MHRITFFITGFLFLFSGIVVLLFPLQISERKSYSSSSFAYSQNYQSPPQDKNLIKGNWQSDGAKEELLISRLWKNGALEVKYSNSKQIYIEKAGWTNSSDVVRLFVIYRQDEKQGYSLSLNYDAEKDLLTGAYVDGSDNKSYNVIFKRIK